MLPPQVCDESLRDDLISHFSKNSKMLNLYDDICLLNYEGVSGTSSPEHSNQAATPEHDNRAALTSAATPLNTTSAIQVPPRRVHSIGTNMRYGEHPTTAFKTDALINTFETTRVVQLTVRPTVDDTSHVPLTPLADIDDTSQEYVSETYGFLSRIKEFFACLCTRRPPRRHRTSTAENERRIAHQLHMPVTEFDEIVRPLWNNLVHQIMSEHIAMSSDWSNNNHHKNQSQNCLTVPPRIMRTESSFPKMHAGGLIENYGKNFRLIGRGTGGTVRLSRTEAGKNYAIKEFRHRRDRESVHHYVENLTREYCIGRVLSHPNVIQTIDLVVDHGKCYEIMEYCPADLFNYIQSGQYGEAEVNCCFKQIIRGVAYLHSMGLAHRDLKPENICMDADQRLKIIDFGLCYLCDERHRAAKGLCGSSPYIAPEEWLSEEYNPQKVDVWSCGIIYLTLFFHAFPWECAVEKDVHYSHFLNCRRGNQVYPIFGQLSNGGRVLLQKMLEPDPKKRIDISDVLVDPWFKDIQVCRECGLCHNHSLPQATQ